MATVFLKRKELNGEFLPRVYLVCGQHDADLEEVEFVYEPFPLLRLIAKVQWTRHQTAHVPLCSHHQDYFSREHYLALVGIVGCIILFIVACFLKPESMSKVPSLVHAIPVVGFGILLLYVGLGVYHRFSVHTDHVDDKGMRLACVSPKFAKALKRKRKEAGVRSPDPGSVPVAGLLGFIVVSASMFFPLAVASVIALVIGLAFAAQRHGP